MGSKCLNYIRSGRRYVPHMTLRYHRQQIRPKMDTTIGPILLKAEKDGSEQVINADELHRYTRHRWLRDEPRKLAARYRSFNVEALVAVAIDVVGNGAKNCVKILKCIEGQYNKALLLTMDNGYEIFAKLPNPNAGPTFYTTASEVATRHFLRETLGLPIPQIFAWSSDPTNPVGAEYIIEEKAKGTPLGDVWDRWPKESQLDMVTQIVDLQAKLGSVSFSKHGCIYYKSDLESKAISAESLAANLYADETYIESNFPLLHNLALGPLTESKLWEGKKMDLQFDRGPWDTLVEYTKAIGTNEMLWAESYAMPRINFQRSDEFPELPNDYISLLEKYVTLIPYLLPEKSDNLSQKTLSHPDLHLDNVLIDERTRKITHVIDWQSTSVCEIFLQSRVPPMLPDSQTLSNTKYSFNNDRKGENTGSILSYYKHLTELRNPRLWGALKSDHVSLRTLPIFLACGAWDRDDLFSFRHSLIQVVARWREIVRSPVPCPISFTDRDLALHAQEMELVEGLGSIMHQLQDEGLIPLGGMVPPGYYEQAQQINNKFRNIFIDLADGQQQRDLHSKVWPY